MKRLFLILSAFIAFSVFSVEAAVEEKSATLKSGANMSMGVNYVRYNIVLKADFTFSDFSSVMVGRGGEGVYRTGSAKVGRAQSWRPWNRQPYD